MEELSGSIDSAHLLRMINRWKIVFHNFFPQRFPFEGIQNDFSSLSSHLQ